MPETDTDQLALLRGEVVPDRPVPFRHHIGRVPRDMVMGGSPFLLLISDRFRQTLEDNGLTGWATYPVEVRRKRGELIHGYAGLSVTGRTRPLNALGFVVGLARRGLPGLVEDTWGGSDFELDGASGYIVVTARVRDALRAARITNISFQPLK